MTSTTIKSNAASVVFDGVSKIYHGNADKHVTAVDNISLQVEAGQLVTLLGPSGCGKTTTLRMIAGLEMASSGRIYIGGEDVTQLPATDRDVSMVFQSYALFPHMTVGENVAYGLTVSGYSKTEVKARAEAGLDLVGLAGYSQRLPSELSGGQQQRVAVARALVLEPQVLLFDEPLSNLDAKLRRRVREEIREIQSNLGLTVVYVTHDQEEALAVSDRIVVMNNAVIAQAGAPRDLYQNPDSAFVADFIGEANLFSCEITRITADQAEVQLGPMNLTLPSRKLSIGRAQLAVRPNRIILKPPNITNSIPGIVRKATYVGNHMEYIVAPENIDIEEVFVTSGEVEQFYPTGESVAITFAATGPVLLPDGNGGST